MRYRLRNNRNPALTIGITPSVWYGILELAEENGWNPMGTIPPDDEDSGLVLAGLGFHTSRDWGRVYWSDSGGLVLLKTT